jgi:hypothetical protein
MWRYLKKDYLYSKYHSASEKFEAAILKSLDSISTTNKTIITKLMNLKFNLFDCEIKIKPAGWNAACHYVKEGS